MLCGITGTEGGCIISQGPWLNINRDVYIQSEDVDLESYRF